jgi:hypothetical protein
MKYPRTPYFTFSESADKADIRESGYFDLENFHRKDLVVTIKMDGSNCLWTREHIAARNGKQANGISFDYAKQLHSVVKNQIPENINIYGEWLYAKHSIFYEKDLSLDGYFQVFGIYDSNTNIWGSWQDVIKYSALLKCISVPVIRTLQPISGIKSLESTITEIAKMVINRGHEGIVVRNIEAFTNRAFAENIAKYVRASHVQTDQHWSKQKIVINKIDH